MIGLERIKMEEDKVKGVLDWLTPKCVKDVQKFLGLVNYYCQFIKDFASIVLWQPLNQCPIAAQAINLTEGYLVGNMSCVIYKRT